jgi:hypothetical protein
VYGDAGPDQRQEEREWEEREEEEPNKQLRALQVRSRDGESKLRSLKSQKT